jgi:hypothetical protein
MYFDVLFSLCFAIFFVKAAEAERAAPVVWLLASVLLWVVARWGLQWGLLAAVGLQVVLFALLGLLLEWRRRKRGERW